MSRSSENKGNTENKVWNCMVSWDDLKETKKIEMKEVSEGKTRVFEGKSEC